MKKLLLFFAFIVGFVSTQAQDNPFAEFGYTPKIATLSQGQFNESFDNDTIVQIGSVLFNTKSKQIVAFVEYDTLYSEATLEPDIVSRWMSPDPLESKFPSLSPYNFVNNTPINAIDPDGRDIVYVNGFSYHDNNNQARGGSVNRWRQNKYWNTDRNFTQDVNNYFNDYKNHFVSASQLGGSAEFRQRMGYETALQMVKTGEIELNANNPITVVMHSQGNAYGAGYMQGILAAAKEQGIDVDVNGVMLSVHQPEDIDMTGIQDKAIQYTYSNDDNPVVSPMGKIIGVEDANDSNNGYEKGGLKAHGATINDSEAFDAIKTRNEEKKIYTKKKE